MENLYLTAVLKLVGTRWYSCKQDSRQGKNHDFFKFVEIKKINELIETINKLSNNFSGLVTSGFGSAMPAGCQLDHADSFHN